MSEDALDIEDVTTLKKCYKYAVVMRDEFYNINQFQGQQIKSYDLELTKLNRTIDELREQIVEKNRHIERIERQRAEHDNIVVKLKTKLYNSGLYEDGSLRTCPTPGSCICRFCRIQREREILFGPEDKNVIMELKQKLETREKYIKMLNDDIGNLRFKVYLAHETDEKEDSDDDIPELISAE